jgi:hypothetical protein
MEFLIIFIKKTLKFLYFLKEEKIKAMVHTGRAIF